MDFRKLVCVIMKASKSKICREDIRLRPRRDNDIVQVLRSPTGRIPSCSAEVSLCSTTQAFNFSDETHPHYKG